MKKLTCICTAELDNIIIEQFIKKAYGQSAQREIEFQHYAIEEVEQLFLDLQDEIFAPDGIVIDVDINWLDICAKIRELEVLYAKEKTPILRISTTELRVNQDDTQLNYLTRFNPKVVNAGQNIANYISNPAMVNFLTQVNQSYQAIAQERLSFHEALDQVTIVNNTLNSIIPIPSRGLLGRSTQQHYYAQSFNNQLSFFAQTDPAHGASKALFSKSMVKCTTFPYR